MSSTRPSRLLRLSRWQRFWKLDVPNGAIGLVWNGMMSIGGGWFFLVAAEAISVLNETYTLPGIGSYAGAAIDAGELGKVVLAIVTMAIMVIGVNVLFWRPLVAWSEKFKNEQSEAAEVPRSVVLNLLRRSHWPRVVGRLRRRLAGPVDRAAVLLLGDDDRPLVARSAPPAGRRRRVLDRRRRRDRLRRLAAARPTSPRTRVGRVLDAAVAGAGHLGPGGGPGRRGHRGVGADRCADRAQPRAARLAQPIVQILASFPANFLFPFAVWAFVETGISLNVGGILLMSLGAQWYILFNAIAGAQAIPTDLREAIDDLGVHGWQRWKRLILPAIFPSYVTGGITASGGAWNASIVAEIVTYGGTTLTATGLGAYIAEATESRRLPPDPGRCGRHVLLRRRPQPAALAPPLPPRRNALRAVDAPRATRTVDPFRSRIV